MLSFDYPPDGIETKEHQAHKGGPYHYCIGYADYFIININRPKKGDGVHVTKNRKKAFVKGIATGYFGWDKVDKRGSVVVSSPTVSHDVTVKFTFTDDNGSAIKLILDVKRDPTVCPQLGSAG